MEPYFLLYYGPTISLKTLFKKATEQKVTYHLLDPVNQVGVYIYVFPDIIFCEDSGEMQ